MKAGRLELLVGILIGFLPFLGLPSHFFKIILPIIGIFILYNTYKKRPLGNKRLHKDAFEKTSSAHKTKESKIFALENDVSEKAEALPQQEKRTLSHIPIATNKNPSSQEVSSGKKKHLLLSLQMLGYHQKQNLETSRLATRINVEKKKVLLDLQAAEVKSPEEGIDLSAKETPRDNENLELIVDEELLLSGENLEIEPLTISVFPEKEPDIIASEEPVGNKESGGPEHPEKEPEEALEFFSIHNQAKMDAGFLSRIGDEIEE